MNFTRRRILTTATAAAGATTFLPFQLRAGGHLPNEFKTDAGLYVVHPVAHASFVMETPVGTIYVDPVGAADDYSDFPAADLILVTHEHGDHLSTDVLSAILGDDTILITNAGAHAKMTEELQARSTVLANGEAANALGSSIEAIPAYNITEERLNFHPEGRDNGYVLNLAGLKTYISGDTEDTPEMRALEGIDLAFVCMNLPFTMDAKAAASAVSEFGPKYCYPYHYRGRDGGTQDPAEFASMLEGTEVKMGDWYKPGEL